MADWNLPTLASLKSDLLNLIKGRDDDCATQFDSATSTATNVVTGTKRWNSTGSKWEKWDGSTWVDLTPSYGINVSYSANSGNADAVSGRPLAQTGIGTRSTFSDKIAYIAGDGVMEIGQYLDFHNDVSSDYAVRLGVHPTENIVIVSSEFHVNGGRLRGEHGITAVATDSSRFGAGLVVEVPNGSDYNPTLTFHRPARYTGSIKLESGTSFSFRNEEDTGYASITVDTVNATTVNATTVAAPEIYATNLHAPNIDTTTVNATTVNATTVAAPEIYATNLHAPNIDTTTVNATTVNATTVNATTVNATAVNAINVMSGTGIYVAPDLTSYTNYAAMNRTNGYVWYTIVVSGVNQGDSIYLYLLIGTDSYLVGIFQYNGSSEVFGTLTALIPPECGVYTVPYGSMSILNQYSVGGGLTAEPR